MHTIGQYLVSLEDSFGLTRTLGPVELCRDSAGRPIYAAGNSAVVFRVRIAGREEALRCYLHRQPHLRAIYGERDGLLFTPGQIATDDALDEVLALFERQGDALHYRIARMLRSPLLRLPQLAPLLNFKAPDHAAEEATPELFAAEGLWGYRIGGEVAIPPLYDCGFDFSEGLAAVRLGTTWHYIDTAGRTRISCPGCEVVKPFRGEWAEIVRNGRREPLAREGGGICQFRTNSYICR